MQYRLDRMSASRDGTRLQLSVPHDDIEDVRYVADSRHTEIKVAVQEKKMCHSEPRNDEL